MKIVEVNTKELEDRFIQVHVDINEAHPSFIRPLDKDIRAVFDPKKNKAYRFGEAARWLLFDEESKAVGRIAAFTNKKYKNKGDDIPIGGIGFFDCINNRQFARLLFDRAKSWLHEHGMQAMDGPINFGERDRWWGLLVEGFEPPLYRMNFNPPYYSELFEEYGFKNFYNQICWHTPFIHEPKQLAEKFYVAHDRLSTDPEFRAERIRKDQDSKFAKDFATVFNKAWAGHDGNRALSEKQVSHFFSAMKPIMDEDLVWFAYHGNQPIATWISIPDINMAIRGLNGKLGLFGKVRFFINKFFGKIDRFVGIIFGVVPEFQGMGADYYLIVEAEKHLKKSNKYKELELQWQGDFNPKMLNISKNLGSKQKRRLVTYRYIFDRSAPFHRHPVLN